MADQLKIQMANELHDKFLRAKGAVLAEYRGMTVCEMTDLRCKLRESSLELKVIKNKVAMKAAEGTPFESISDKFVGPISIALSYDDVVASAKIMTKFAKENTNLKLKGGIIEGEVVETESLNAIAELPPKEVLLGKMLGSMNAPVTNFVGVLGGVLRQMVLVLNAIKEKKGGN